MVNIFSPIAKKVRRCISEYKKGQAQESVGFFELYRFATCPEWFAILLASVACCVMGLAIPLSCISYGEFTALLIDRTMTAPCTSSPTFIMEMFGGGKILVDPTPEQQREALLEDSKAFAISNVVLWLIQLLLGIAGVDLLNYVAIRQINRIRRLLLQSVLRQDITWYDTNTDSTFSSKLTDDIEKIKEGIGEKVGIFMYLLSSFVTAVLIALLYGWKLTLVIMSSTPLVILSTAFVAQIQSRLTAKELEAYGSAGRVAEEVLGSIKTVVAFAGQKKEEERYAEHLKPVRDLGNRKGYYSGLGTGLLWFILYSSYSVSFYYGVSLILEDRTKEYKEYTPAVLFIVFFGILGGAENLGLTAPLLETFNIARGAAVGVFALIDRKSDIDSTGKDGKMLDNPDGDIVFENVYFSYPARPDITILENFNLTIRAGETLALVGLTGSGKSTCVQLVQRLYDPQKGKITVAGHDLRDLNVKSLRSAIGVVGQEPVLFGTTIADNIRYGRPSCTQEDIEEAARNANCHDFIMKLKDGYETKVGERGGRLSGGQRQRIAIARALIRHPTILLLDEATSALDTRSQAKVQKALDKAAVGRTTIIVSHRLSTIVNADRIVYMDHGQIREMGSHKELMENKGLYFNLVQTDDLKPSAEARRISESSQSRKHSKHIESSDDESSSSESGDTRVTSALSIDTSIPDKSLVDKIKMDSTFLRLLKLNSPEWLLLVLGCIASVAVGATLPMFAIVFGDIYGIFLLDDEKEIMDNTKVYCVYFMLIGIITGFGSFVQLSVFNIAGSRLIARLRKAAFSAMMRQEMAWFDDDKNSVGALSSRLAGECSSIQGAVGGRIGSMLQAYATLVIGLFIAFYFSWKLSLISGVIIPLVIIAIFLEEKYLSHENVEGKAAIETSASIATEAIRNIRTVASLCQEMPFEERYMKEMDRVNKQAHAKTRLRGLIFSFGQGAPLLSYGLCLSYGGVMIANNELDYVAVIKVSEALMFGGWMLGQAMAYTPNINEAKDSARRIFKLFDREPKISSSSECKPLKKWKADGDIQYDEVKFSYPSQPDLPVLRGLNLEVKRGTTVALVGPSGCGKSTTIQLLQRLYDSFEGKITLDKLDIAEEIPLEVLRGQLGLVSQEPVLFDLTIAENIQYGDSTREVLMEEVIEAAKNANIHNFIKELPLGYETRIGNGGTQLSGGQKQRIAIARALVRNPRVLLLDEATSALDTLSEKLVQEALDNAGKGRTCITIAHRLTTVRGADMIHVFDQGEVVESGTHNQLMRREGAYWQLYRTEQGL